MLGKPITYTTFDDEPQTITETFWFHISQPELMEYVANDEEGITGKIRAIEAATTMREVIKVVKDIILMAYGKRSEDKKSFMKNDELKKEFYYHAAYPALFMELSTNEEKCAEFIKGILPKELGGDIEKAFKEAQQQVDAKRAELTSPTS